jgi:hypothetical protein
MNHWLGPSSGYTFDLNSHHANLTDQQTCSRSHSSNASHIPGSSI